MTAILHQRAAICLATHPDDYWPIVRRCHRVRNHDGPHDTEPENSSSLGDQWGDYNEEMTA